MRLNRIGLGLLAVTASVGLVACDSDSDFETFTATCSADQENPPTSPNPSGTCRATVLVSKSLDRVDVSITQSGLANITQAHIHRAPRGTNGGVIFWLYDPNRPADYPSSTEIGKIWTNPSSDTRDQPLTQTIIDDLRAGNLYVNFHTTQFPGGAIRGQLTRQ
jgi:CHRD domain-containing protein